MGTWHWWLPFEPGGRSQSEAVVPKNGVVFLETRQGPKQSEQQMLTKVQEAGPSAGLSCHSLVKVTLA